VEKLMVAADSAYTVRGLSEAADRAGISLGLLVELDATGVRTGVSPGGAAELARLIDSLPGLELLGVMGFPTPPETRPIFQETLDLLDEAGLPHPVVSGGSTKCAFEAHTVPEFTEYRAGEYAVGGAGHLQDGRHTVEQCALRVLTTVVSRPTGERAILDAGSKAMSATIREDKDGRPSVGTIVEYPDARFGGSSEEHGHVDVSACERKPEIGDRVQVLPVHPCPCVNEHDEVVAVRGGEVEAIWPVHARGKIR
jgi:D-serine deaminase-like pyridoxal phosphate-dependent protein